MTAYLAALQELDRLYPESRECPHLKRVCYSDLKPEERIAWVSQMRLYFAVNYARYEYLEKYWLDGDNKKAWNKIKNDPIAFKKGRGWGRAVVLANAWQWFADPTDKQPLSRLALKRILGYIEPVGIRKYSLSQLLKQAKLVAEQENLVAVADRVNLALCELSGGDDCPFENDEEQNKDLQRESAA